MERWFSGIIKISFRSKQVVSLWVFAAMEGFGAGVLARVIKKAVLAAFTCIFALVWALINAVLLTPLLSAAGAKPAVVTFSHLTVGLDGGALVGTIIGAMKGQTTETGFLRGSGIGAVAGAITAVQLLESLADGEPLSKVALLCSLVNGKVFMEWVSPAVLKAYQWQISAVETAYREISDIYDTSGMRGLSQDCIQKLPEFTYQTSNILQQCHELCCSICLQDFKDGDSSRKLPSCGHFFHLECLDEWLTQNGSCPMCRNYVCNDTDVL